MGGVDVGDIIVTADGAGDQGGDGQVEEAVVDGDFAGLDDADVGAADGESAGDGGEDADVNLQGNAR